MRPTTYAIPWILMKSVLKLMKAPWAETKRLKMVVMTVTVISTVLSVCVRVQVSSLPIATGPSIWIHGVLCVLHHASTMRNAMAKASCTRRKKKINRGFARNDIVAVVKTYQTDADGMEERLMEVHKWGGLRDAFKRD